MFNNRDIPPDCLAEIKANVDRIGCDWLVPIFQATADNLIDVVQVQRGHAIPMGRMRKATRPVLVWIGDDNDPSYGPEGWSCAAQVADWTRSTLIHAAGGERKHYEMAVAGAIMTGRMTLIETGTQRAQAWGDLFMPRSSGMVVWPRGGVHPLPRSAFH